MRFRLIAALLMLGLFLTLPTFTLAQEKKKPGKGPAPSEVLDGAKLLQPGDYKVTLKTAPGSDRTFIATLAQKRLVGTPKAGKGNNAVVQALNRMRQAESRLARRAPPPRGGRR